MSRGPENLREHDVYASIDAINESIPKIAKTIEDAKRDDPEFFEELRNIFSNNHEH